MKVVGERKILASFVAVKLNLMAEMIRKEKEKTKVKAQLTTKKDKKIQTSITPSFVTAEILTGCRSSLDLALVRISAPPRQLLRRYRCLKFGVFYLVSS